MTKLPSTQVVALRWCFQLNKSDGAEEMLRSGHHLIAPDLVIAEITDAAWKFVMFDRMTPEIAVTALREIVKAFEELVPMSALRDRALAIAIELRHPAFNCFYLSLAERRTAPLVTADERLIRGCAGTIALRPNSCCHGHLRRKQR